RITEKLLANADRCQDASTHFRDAADLGMIALRGGPFPAAALTKARDAYGEDVDRKLTWALTALADSDCLAATATALGMAVSLLDAAMTALRREASAARRGVDPS
ncbi:MAG TPA: hypothetical protein VIG49_01855, partial [Acetobacteraceae bacterium]